MTGFATELTHVLENMSDGFLALNPKWEITYVNRRGEQMLGQSRDQLLGRYILEAFPEGAGSSIHQEMATARQEKRVAEFEAFYAPRGRWFDVRGFPAADGGLTVFFRDVTKRKESDEALALQSRFLEDRLADQRAQRFLAQAGSALASTLDLETLMASVGDLAVPALGDCCIVDVLEDEGAARRIEVVWSNALAQDGPTRASRHTYETDARAVGLLLDNNSTQITAASDDVLRALTSQEDEVRRLQRAGARSVIVAPLQAGGRLVGTLTLVSAERAYNEAEAALATEFARRVALAADNATLYEAARLASQAKSDFLAVMSHELRTPLTTVMGYTDLLLAEVTGALPKQSHNYVERIRTAAWHLLGLIEQILIYTRVEVGREQVHVERVPVDYVLRDAAALIEPVAAEKGLTFNLAPPTEAAYVDTDLTKLRQILLNLLANAVKFTDHGDITLGARLSATSVEFVVQDTGIGIAPEHLDRIFDSFWQVDQSATRRAGGTGLGLSVARKLARLLGGEVSAVSRPEVGATFVLQLPRALPRASKSPAAT